MGRRNRDRDTAAERVSRRSRAVGSPPGSARQSQRPPRRTLAPLLIPPVLSRSRCRVVYHHCRWAPPRRAGQPAPRPGLVRAVRSSSGVAEPGERASPLAPGTRPWGHRDARGAPESSLVHALHHDLHGRAASDGWPGPSSRSDRRAGVRHQPCARAHASLPCPVPADHTE